MTENRKINLSQGNYNEKIAGNYYQQQGNFGIGHMSGGEIKDNAKVAGVIKKGEEEDLEKTVVEIQALLEQLEETYLTKSTTEQMIVAAKAVEQIESNPTWKKKAIAALKGGSLKVIEKNPVGAFVVGAIKGWKES